MATPRIDNEPPRIDDLLAYFGEAAAVSGLSSSFGKLVDMSLSGFSHNAPRPEGRIKDSIYGLGKRSGIVTRLRAVHEIYCALSPIHQTILAVAYTPMPWQRHIEEHTGDRERARAIMQRLGALAGVAIIGLLLEMPPAPPPVEDQGELVELRPDPFSGRHRVDAYRTVGRPLVDARKVHPILDPAIAEVEANRGQAMLSRARRLLGEALGAYEAAGGRMEVRPRAKTRAAHNAKTAAELPMPAKDWAAEVAW